MTSLVLNLYTFCSVIVICHFNIELTEAGVMHEAGYVDYLEHLVPLPLLDIIICPFLDYYILSIFHNLGSPLSYHTLIFDLMSSRNMYLYNAYIYTYILLPMMSRSVWNKIMVYLVCFGYVFLYFNHYIGVNMKNNPLMLNLAIKL